MDITEAMELAREITDPDDGGVETLMDHGCDVIAALSAEVERLRAAILGCEAALADPDSDRDGRESAVHALFAAVDATPHA